MSWPCINGPSKRPNAFDGISKNIWFLRSRNELILNPTPAAIKCRPVHMFFGTKAKWEGPGIKRKASEIAPV